MSRARVLLLNAALGPLDYRVPHGMNVKPGSIVVAPLGPRQLVGVVWEEESFPDVESVGDNRLRNLLELVDAPPPARAAAPPDRMDGGLLSQPSRRRAADGAGVDGGAGGDAHGHRI